MGNKLAKDNPLYILNKIIEFSSLLPINNFLLIQQNIYIKQENYDEFIDLILELKNKHNKLEKLSYRSFYSHFIGYLYKILVDKKEISHIELNTFFKETEDKFPLTNIKIVAPIWGVFNSNNNSMTIGEFEIIPKEKYRPHSNYNYNGPEFNFFISMNIDSRDDEYAEAVQKNNLDIFETAIKFILGPNSDKYSVSITESFQIQELRYFENSTKGIIRNERIYVSTKDLLNLNQEFIVNSRVWRILSRPSNEFEMRLKNAILWIGKAISEIELTKCFIQYFFGLESILQRDTNFGPSINHQIAETIALKL